jgi:hypothetical protein
MPLPNTWRRPSLALKAIEQEFGRPMDSDVSGLTWDERELQKLKFLLDMLSNVDERILFATLSPEQSLDWRRRLAAIQSAVRRWQSHGGGIFEVQGIVVIYRLLKSCPDEIVPLAQARLTFIVDPKLQSSIARDCASLDALVLDEEWKAATVIGGSVVEALLLDALLHGGSAVKANAAETSRVANGERGWSKGPLERWDLWKLIAVARELGLIDSKVANVCDGVRDFRNLIHAGRERAEAPCDKGTALAAAAAVENLLAVFSGSRP